MAITDGVTAGRYRPPRSAAVTGGLTVAVVVALALIPAGAVALRSISDSSALDAAGSSAWARMLGSARTWRILGVTMGQAAVSTVFAVLIGTPVAYMLARYRFPGRQIVRTLATVPFVLPSVVLGSAFAAIFSDRGLFEARGSWWLVIAAHVCFNLAVVVRTVGAGVSGLDPETESAARILGRSRPQVLWSVVLPQIRGSIAAAAAIIFLFCLTSFGVVVILGGGSVTTMEVEIWVRATRQFDVAGAAVLGVVQFLAVIATLGVSGLVVRHGSNVSRHRTHTPTVPATVGERAHVAVGSGVIVLICGVPLAALVIRSLSVPGGFGLDNWLNLGSVLGGTTLHVSPSGAMVNSLTYAAMALVIALPMSLSSARFIAGRQRGLLDGLILVPLGLSATMIGLGLLILSPSLPFDLRRSFLLIPAAQLLVAVPLITRVLIPALTTLDTSVLDAASVLGASPRQRFWRVEFMSLLPALVAGAGLGFVTCMGEFGATVFVSRSDTMTVPVLVERLMSRPGGAGYGQAMVLCVILVITCGAILGAVDRLASGRGRELMPI